MNPYKDVMKSIAITAIKKFKYKLTVKPSFLLELTYVNKH